MERDSVLALSLMDLKAAAVSEGGDGAVFGEALQLSLSLHGHARDDVVPPAA